MRPKPSVLYGWLFAAASFLTLLIYATGWHTNGYWLLLSALGILSGVLGMMLLVHTGLRWKPLVAVILGLIIGQWWIIEFAAVQMIWSSRGFAP